MLPKNMADLMDKFARQWRAVVEQERRRAVVNAETGVVTEPPLVNPMENYYRPEPVANADPNTQDWDAVFRADVERRRLANKRQRRM